MPLRSHFSYFRSSFQFKLFCVFTLLTAFTAVFSLTLYITSEIREKRDYTREKVHLQAQQLADAARLPLYAEDRAFLQRLAEEASNEPEIRAVEIVASDGRLMAAVHAPTHSDTSAVISQTVDVQSHKLVGSLESSLSGGLDVSVSRFGTVRIERGTADLSRAIRDIAIPSACSAFLFWLLVSVLCYMALRKVTHSFNILMSGIETMRCGDFTSRIEVVSDDEPGRAARAVNDLASALLQRSEENICLQEERLNLERRMFQSQKLESMGIMAGGIAHDYNNLLQSILGNIELASLKLDPGSAPHKYITNAISSGKHAAHLTNLMLTYVGKGYMTKKGLNLNELVRENTGMLKTAASSAVSMELHLSAEFPMILADEAHIQQIVMNLIINSTESIHEQPGLIRIATGIQDCDQACLSDSLLHEKPEPGRYVFLEVSDNGCGMSKETLARLFDPFFTTKFTGRGLGMSAVMGIIRMHSGALFVESEPGKGTTFRVLFPVSESALPAEAPDLAPPSPAPAKQLSGVALVVDDEKPVLRICKKMLELCGLTVITACDGIDAVAKFHEHVDEITVVLMDLTMPNMDGITAMGEIYGIRPDAKVILSSGFNEEELSVRITGHAPSGFIRKPYSMSALETELRSIMSAV